MIFVIDFISIAHYFLLLFFLMAVHCSLKEIRSFYLSQSYNKQKTKPHNVPLEKQLVTSPRVDIRL